MVLQSSIIQNDLSINKIEINQLSDEQIVQHILSSENPALFEKIYERYALKIYQKSISFTKDDAEAKDLAHDILIKIYLNLNKFSGKSKFSTWVYSITYNQCIDHQAKKTKQLTLIEELKVVTDITYIEEPSDKELLEMNLQNLNKLLDEVSPSEKALLLMKYQDSMSVKDIATMMGAGESAIKMKLKRSKEKLKNLYEKQQR